MAFHQTTRQVQRTIRLNTDTQDAQPDTHHVPQSVVDSQTWVVFSPETDAGTTTSYLSSLQDSQQTPGRSRLSDLGSLNTLARSDVNSQPANSAVHPVHSDAMDEDAAEDDAELDSLDSHLPDFRSNPNAHGRFHASTTVLPGHDGLGSFRLDITAMDSEMQDHIYAFERYNPRRVKRRRGSFDLTPLELESEQAQEADRNRRIEAWRLDQSRIFLEEIQKETRRRRLSGPSSQRPRLQRAVSAEAGTTSPAANSAFDNSAGAEWHEQDEVEG